ncbi:MAG: class I SAM-dependent methyltransferase [Phycisphaeraceae bacterium]|nr:class I SAM-dependent methyltransferase [Phycisphaeraceae bacterium]
MPTYEPFDWYETPVYYDIIYDVDTKKDTTFLEQCYAQHASDGGKSKKLSILEPACGTGRLMTELATRGHRVAGVDLSKGMLDFARKRFKEKGVKGKLIQAPMQDFDLHNFPMKRRGSAAQTRKGFDLAHILVSSFKYLQTEQDAADCLNAICDHLRVGGVLLLGIHLTDPDDDNRYLERWRAKRDHLDVICTVRTNPPNHKQRTEDLRSRVVVRDLKKPNAVPKRYESNWTFRTYSPSQLRSLLRKAPRLKHIATYDFHHDINTQSSLDGDDLGVVLVLRRER